MYDVPNHIGNVPLIDHHSMSSDITSSSQNINEVAVYAIQAIWSNGSSPVGTLVLQGSNNDSDYTDITSAPVSGNSGSILINAPTPGYGFIRVFYDSTSGDGSLTVSVNMKNL